MKTNKDRSKLASALKITLAELDRLTSQIQASQDYSEDSAYVACLRELIAEQTEGGNREDLIGAAHQAG